MKRIVIFASGAGTNAEAIMNYFSQSSKVEVVAIFTNNRFAKVIEKASQRKIPLWYFSREAFRDQLPDVLALMKIDLIVLAGFLWKVPLEFIRRFSSKSIVNIHPSLLPKFGGKGMYGSHVHKAVIDSGERFSGITIHYVNEEYDQGDIIFQEKVSVDSDDSAESLAFKVHQLEYRHYAEVIESLLR